jgi:hypothetical protein
MKYNLRSIVDPSDPLNGELADWPIFSGNQDIEATPPENTLSLPYPADAERFFAVEEFRPPPVTIYSENFDGGAVIPVGWSTGAHIGDTGTTQWEVGIPTHNLGPPGAASAPNCVGTNLATEYGPDTNIFLRTPSIDLTAAGAATVNYDQFVYTDTFFQDFGTLRVLDATDDSVIAVLEAVVEGASFDWIHVSNPLPAEALGKMVKFEFGFVADDITGDVGWLIDNVEVTIP